MTSVKEFRIEEPATAEELGVGAFEFTNDYSVFDWGKMPDEIPGKGRSLCTMGAFNFERLEAAGITTHYRGVQLDEGAVTSLDAATDPPRTMAIELTQVPPLPHDGRSYDYETFHGAAGENYLIPLEIVFRNRVPVGSSLRRRADPADVGLDRTEWPDEAVDLDRPIVEFSTKFEESDRYLDRKEADRIAGAASIGDLESIARSVNDLVTEQATGADLVHDDGKIECLYVDGEIKVADVVGTFDENRFSADGVLLSKEVLRQYHKRTQPEWVEAVSAAKDEAQRRDVADWRPLCDHEPEALPPSVIETVSEMYRAGVNAYTGTEYFDAPPLSRVLGAVTNL